MRPIEELTQKADQIKKEIESTFNDQEKYENLSTEERADLIRDYLFIIAYDRMGKTEIKPEDPENPVTRVHDEIEKGYYTKNGSRIETDNDKLAEDFASIEDGGLLWRTIQKPGVHSVMFGQSFNNTTNRNYKSKLISEINGGNLETYLRGEEERERQDRERRERERQEAAGTQNAGNPESDAGEVDVDANRTDLMRPREELITLSTNIKGEIEEVFSDPDKFKSLSIDQKKVMIKEYMFIQGMEDPDMVRRDHSRSKAPERIYDEINLNRFTTGQKTHKGNNAPILDLYSKMEDGELLLNEMKSDMAKDVFYGLSLRGGYRREVADKAKGYYNALKNGTIKEYRQLENKDQQQIKNEEGRNKEEAGKEEQIKTEKKGENSKKENQIDEEQRKKRRNELYSTGRANAQHLSSDFLIREEERTELSRYFAEEQSKKLYDAVKNVDFNMLGKGSPEFNGMKTSLKNLKDYARSESFDPAHYYDLQKKAMNSVNAYLEKKQRDIDSDRSRLNDPKKQKREQPRIHTATQILEELEKSYKKGRNAVIENERDRAKTYCLMALEKESYVMKNGDLKPTELVSALTVSARMVSVMNDPESELNRLPDENESLMQYKSNLRFNNTPQFTDMRTNSGEELKYGGKYIFNSIVKDINGGMSKEQAYSVENVKAKAMEKNRFTQEPAIDTGLDKSKYKTSDRVNNYKNKLFSDATKRQLNMIPDQPKVEKKTTGLVKM